MRKTAQLIVARAEVAGEVHVDEQAPDIFRVPAGTDLYVKFPYHFVESSPDKEAYTFELDVRLGDQAPPAATATWHDRPGIPDELQGILQHCISLRDTGEYELAFRASARYRKTPWGGGSEDDEATVGVEGRVRVTVG